MSFKLFYSGIVFVILFSCNHSNQDTPLAQSQQELSSQVTEVTTRVIHREDFKREIISQGTLHSMAMVDVKSQLDVPVIELNTFNGQEVKKNEVLLKFDDSAIKRDMQKLQLSLEKIKREREKQLIAKLGYGFSTEDSAKIPLDVLQMINMDVGFHEKQLEIEEKKAEFEKYTIRAPISGRIADLTLQLMNFPSEEELFTIIDDGMMEARFPVLETHFNELCRGDLVRITPLATGEDFKGVVSEINPRVSEGGMILVHATIPNRQGQLIDGMKCKIAVEKVLPDQLVIPKSTLVMRDNRKVMFYYEEGLAYWQYIATPFENSSSYVVTTEEGDPLPDGKEVIVTGNMNLAHESVVVKAREQK